MGDMMLAGRRILVVEDEYFIAQDVAEELRGRGAEVVGPLGNVRAATEAVRDGRFDGAVLDMNLRGESSEPLADVLRGRSVPILIVSGYSRDALPPHLQDSEYLEKPATADAVAAAVTRIVAS